MGGKQPSLEGHKSGQSNEPLSAPAHALSFQKVIEETKCNPDDGLSSAEAKSRLEKFGNNDLGDDGGVSPAKILLRQVANSMTLVSVNTFERQRTIPNITTGAHCSHGSQFCHRVVD